MAEYIEREALLKAFRLIAKNPDKRYEKGMQDTIDCLVPQVIADVPTADVQPVRRGKWIEKAEDYYRQWQDSGRSWDDMPYFITGLHFACGVCFDKYEINAEGVEFWDFCPHCGADMRGEDNG